MGAAPNNSRSHSLSRCNSAEASSTSSNPRIEHLRRDFVRFRRTHPLRTRIPDSLRGIALAALQDGATESEVRQACGVTSDQIAQWAKARQAQTLQARSRPVQPRVFPLVQDAADLQSGSGEAELPELELRLGSWAIRVRQLQR